MLASAQRSHTRDMLAAGVLWRSHQIACSPAPRGHTRETRCIAHGAVHPLMRQGFKVMKQGFKVAHEAGV